MSDTPLPPGSLPGFHSTILVIDDQATNVDLLRRVLATGGYHAVEGITDPFLAAVFGW